MNRLKELRTKDGYTKAELDKICGAIERILQMWELGKSEPKIKKALLTACDFFGVTIDYLVGRSDK